MQILNTEEEHPPFHLRIAEYDVDERGEPSTEPWRDPSGEPLRDRSRDPSNKSGGEERRNLGRRSVGGEERRSLGRRSVERRNLGRRSVGGEDRRTVGRRSKRGDRWLEIRRSRREEIEERRFVGREEEKARKLNHNTYPNRLSPPRFHRPITPSHVSPNDDNKNILN
uniref:Uncharacterized protein n=1 Tax=Brassica campestris TaxID=3711 RepID=M4F328_BRACM